jgi:hypothetical protein
MGPVGRATFAAMDHDPTPAGPEGARSSEPNSGEDAPGSPDGLKQPAAGSQSDRERSFQPDHRQGHDMISTRRSLTPVRDSITHKFVIMRHEGYLTIGLYADGTPGEIFIKMAKEGSTISGMCQAFCRAFSLALQFGLTVDEAVARFKGMRFEPMGQTNNDEIPETSSIVDYVARYLELHFGSRSRR